MARAFEIVMDERKALVDKIEGLVPRRQPNEADGDCDGEGIPGS